MTLLDLLREMEPDAGWSGDRWFGNGWAADADDGTHCHITQGAYHRECVFIRDRGGTRRVVGEAPSLRDSARMALTGYRAAASQEEVVRTP